MGKKRFGQDTIALVVCVLVAVILQIVISSTTGTDVILIGKAVVNMASIKGILQALIGFVCIIMVCVNSKHGHWVAMIVLGVALFIMLAVIITTKNMSPMNGIVFNIVSIISVIIIRKLVKRIEDFGIRDEVTGLINKRGIEMEINNRLNPHKKLFLLKIRIKKIRNICDTLGYEYGDMALAMLAERFNNVLDGRGVLGKLDGLEYAVVVNGYNNPNEIAQELLASANEKLVIVKDGEAVNCYISAFIGVACYPNDANDCAELMKCADIAMYKAVKEKSNCVRTYNEEMAREIGRRNELEQLIKESLERNYFYMVYQPQYEIKNKCLRGFESLIRLRMPDGTVISPGEFIPVAEATDLVLKIDEYVLKHAMTQFRDVVEQSGNKYIISINVSAKNMGSSDFVDLVSRILGETGYPANCLEIEMTEYSLGKSLNQTVSNIRQLRELGVQVALDDFGTGYTSLAQLLHLPVNLLKIDKSLADDIEDNQVNRDFIDSVIYMGHLMGCEVITEGVENENQLKLLEDHECDFVQGFVWGRPMEYYDAVELAKECMSKVN